MRPGLADRLSRVLVGCHPRRWRERYGEEMLDVLDQHQPTTRTVVNPWASAVTAQLDPAYRTEALALSRLRRAAARETMFTWNVTSAGAVSGLTTVTRDGRDSQPTLAPDGRAVADGSPISNAVYLWTPP